MAKPFDATTKHLIEAHPADWLAFLGMEGHEADPVRSDLSTVTADADQVLRVAGPAPFLLHLELQASYDARLGPRTMLYNVLLDRHHDLPVHSVIILLRREADGPAMTGVVQRHRADGALSIEFHYDVVRVWQTPVDTLLQGGLGTLPLAPLADVRQDRLPGVIQTMQERIDQEAAPGDAGWIWTATNILMGLRYPTGMTQHLLRGVRTMKESLTYQAIVAEGVRETILRLGTKRFGPAGVAVRMALESITGVESLERLAERLLDVESWDELLAGA